MFFLPSRLLLNNGSISAIFFGIFIIAFMILFFWTMNHVYMFNMKKASSKSIASRIGQRLSDNQRIQNFLRDRHVRRDKLRFSAPPNRHFTSFDPLIILFWDGGMRWPNLNFERDERWIKNSDPPCQVTFNRSHREEAHVILFLEKIDHEAVRGLKSWQRIALLTLEPRLSYVDLEEYLSMTDILVSYSRFSEVAINYKYALWGHESKPLIEGTIPDLNKKNNDTLAAMFISNCQYWDGNFRLDYIEQLGRALEGGSISSSEETFEEVGENAQKQEIEEKQQKEMSKKWKWKKKRGIDSYGSCMHSRGLPSGENVNKSLASKDYYFTLQFENTIADDYITEKFWESFRMESVPIYWGAPNIRTVAPGKLAYINALDFESPMELAQYLMWLKKNPDKYLEYFKARRDIHWNNRENFIIQGDKSFISRIGKWYVDHLRK